MINLMNYNFSDVCRFKKGQFICVATKKKPKKTRKNKKKPRKNKHGKGKKLL